MEHTPLISVIIPVYNVEKYLPRCMDSVLAQTYGNLDIILVEDGTKDSSGLICDDYAARDSRVRVIHKENGGLSSARNAGIEAARGEYIAFLDSDDWVEPYAYEYLLSLVQKYQVKLVCAGRYDVKERTGEKKLGLCPKAEERISSQEMVGRIFLWDGCDSSAWDKLYHKSLLTSFRYPLGKICEDVPVTYRIALQTDFVAMGNRPIYNYYHRSGSITTAALSHKTFHFSEHTGKILSYIRENHPALEPQTQYLRVRSLAYNLLSIDTAEPASREAYRQVYADSRKALKEFTPFILTSPYFGKQERITNLMLICGCYRPFRTLYHKIKGS